MSEVVPPSNGATIDRVAESAATLDQLTVFLVSYFGDVQFEAVREDYPFHASGVISSGAVKKCFGLKTAPDVRVTLSMFTSANTDCSGVEFSYEAVNVSFSPILPFQSGSSQFRPSDILKRSFFSSGRHRGMSAPPDLPGKDIESWIAQLRRLFGGDLDEVQPLDSDPRFNDALLRLQQHMTVGQT